jgi:hypothetical protein
MQGRVANPKVWGAGQWDSAGAEAGVLLMLSNVSLFKFFGNRKNGRYAKQGDFLVFRERNQPGINHPAGQG